MTDMNNETHPQPPAEHHEKADTTMAMVVYGLYLASFVLGFTGLVGLVIAYVYKGNGPQWIDEHYRYQIRTFWIGLLYGFVSALLAFVMIGIPLMFAVAIWMIVRIIKGFKGLQEQRAPSNVDTWFV